MEARLGRGIHRRGLFAGVTALGGLIACGGEARRKTERPLQKALPTAEELREIQITNATQRAARIEQEFGGESLLDLPEAELKLYIRYIATLFTQVKTGGRLAPINLINATKVLTEEEFLKRIGQPSANDTKPVLIDQAMRTIIINANSSVFTHEGILNDPTLRISNPNGNPVKMLRKSLVDAYEEIYQLFSFR